MSLCPICFADAGPPLLVRDGVPIFLNRPYVTSNAARSAPVGRIEFSFCRDCDFGFNAAFDPSLAVYDQEYENEQSHSPAFRQHLEHVIDRAVMVRGTSGGPVVEIGCGQGEFLRRLAARIGNGALFVGMDPSCRVSATDHGHLRFLPTTLHEMAPADIPRNPSLVYSRHVIEHIPSPVEFLKEWIRREFVRPTTPILLETPSLEWIARSGAFTDIVYEHCNYFSASSLRRILMRAGFQAGWLELVFESQYFLIAAHKEDQVAEDALTVPAIGQAVQHFSRVESRLRESWRARLAEAAGRGPVAVWGAGAKGVSFVTLLDSGCHRVDCLIDVNPAKQGRFVAVTGHKIVSPETALGRGVVTAFVMNPNYIDEIRARVAALSAPIESIPFEGSVNDVWD
ncbi:MAG TPA: class I SAM-dependent methyltransferase [Bryobacteraceae bacterium]|jgi:SAM-dependent methyltransferase|nr:class I SAM-dependent methyltransferase [Bryobacteraceae bacterium]